MEAKLKQQIEETIELCLTKQINSGCKPFNGIKISDFIANNNEKINKVISELFKLYEKEIKENNNYEFTHQQIDPVLFKYIETTDWDELFNNESRIEQEREYSEYLEYLNSHHYKTYQNIKTKFTEELVNDALNSFNNIDIPKLVGSYESYIYKFVNHVLYDKYHNYENYECKEIQDEIEEFIDNLVWEALNDLAFQKECERQDAYEKDLYKEK